MAAHSPVILDSSSPPPAFRHPTVTPQKSADAVSSSPGLPEISSFFRSHTQGPVPAARTATALLPGFTSASTVWKAAALEAERKDQGGRSNAVEKPSTGKLARPMKKAPIGERIASEVASRTRTPSIPLSEFDFKAEESPGQMQPPEGAKKSGKRAVVPKDRVGKAAGKVKTKTKDGAEQLAEAPEKAVKPTGNASGRKTRSPSISISEYGYESRKAMRFEKGSVEKTSTYFSPSASKDSHPLQTPAPNLLEIVPERNTAGPLLEKTIPPNAAKEPEATTLPAKPSRKPSISLSEFDYRPPEAVGSPAAGPKAAQKPHKRATRAKAAPRAAPAKRAKKSFAKSASIILNSDDPDPAAEAISNTAEDGITPVEQIQAAVHAPKLKKASKKPTMAGAAGSSKAPALDVPAEPGFSMWSQSVYFNPAPVANTIETDATTVESLQNVFAVNDAIRTASPRPVDRHGDIPISPRPAISRRRSWTPAKNTYEVLDPEVDSSGESPAPRKSLANLVGGFGYDGQVVSRPKSPAGEPVTKKRRIEVSEDVAVVPAPRKVKAVKEKVKRVKAPKKKPQTITDLATKAYRVEEPETPNAQSTVSEFFAAQKDDRPSAATAADDTGEVPPTFKKPRKPRAKIDEGESSKPKKTPKPKKVKVKFNEESLVPPLLSPQQARAKEQKQGFLFGTSSQLALEEDVSFVRDLQMAIQESEAGDGPTSSPKRLKTKVSVGQTERGLFWTASRDSWGHVVAANGVRRKAAAVVPQRPTVVAAQNEKSGLEARTAGNDNPVLPDLLVLRQDSLAGGDESLHDSDDRQVVDLCATSPAAAADEDDVLPETAEPPFPLVPGCSTEVEAAAPAFTAPGVDDSWMLLESDTSDDEDHSETVLRISALPIPNPPVVRLSAMQPLRPAMSPIRGNMQARAALATLDGNISILAQTSSAKQQRAFARETSPGALKLPRGRPPKVTTFTSAAAALSPKRRGRPPKSLSPTKADAHEQSIYSASQPPLSSDFIPIDDISDSGSDDRPLKEVLAARAAPLSPRKLKASQQPSPSKSSFVNIDDISDSDAAKQTPSPRRRKADGRLPSPVRTLDLSPSVSGAPPIADGKAAIKPTDACWSDISKVLFPQITAAVKSTPPSREAGGELSWWEKILMYDPIVLEDLTAWLEGRGVGVSVRRKEKKKGRKKKGEVEDEEEYEVVKEELKGWMVQKWCEEKSICCLWREGLRGGVRVRY